MPATGDPEHDQADEQRRPRGLEDAAPVPTVGELRRQQHREMDHVGLGTEGQTKGAAFGWLAGALIGGVVLLVVALAAFDSGAARIVLPIMGVAFGGVAGGVYGGSRRPELTRETVDLRGRPETEPADDLEGRDTR